MKNSGERLLALLSAALLLALSGAGLTAFAEGANYTAGDIDFDAEGSITVTIKDNTPEHKPVANCPVMLYRAGDPFIENNNLCFALTAEFEGGAVDLSDLGAPDIAESLFEYAAQNKAEIEGRQETTDENGAAVFDKLSVGLYLIAQTETPKGYYPIAPFLAAIPMTSADGTELIYDIIAEPKAPVEPAPPGVTQLKVIKAWEDDNDPARPAAVTVQLFCDGEPYGEPVVLNAENEWTYTWTELEDGHSWTALEWPVPTNYKASYDYTTQLVTVTNTKKLIQTGQLKWPVPALICAGALIFMLGWALKLSHKREAGK